MGIYVVISIIIEKNGAVFIFLIILNFIEFAKISITLFWIFGLKYVIEFFVRLFNTNFNTTSYRESNVMIDINTTELSGVVVLSEPQKGMFADA